MIIQEAIDRIGAFLDSEYNSKFPQLQDAEALSRLEMAKASLEKIKESSLEKGKLPVPSKLAKLLDKKYTVSPEIAFNIQHAVDEWRDERDKGSASKRRTKKSMRKNPLFWVTFCVFVAMLVFSIVTLFVSEDIIPKWVAYVFSPTGSFGAVLQLALALREWRSDRKEKATDVSGPSVTNYGVVNYGVVNICTTGKEREGIYERRKKFEVQKKEIDLSDADTRKAYQNKIKTAMSLLPRGEFRKAKNTFEKLLKVYGYTVDICMGFLRVYSKNGTTWKSKEIIKNIDTIEYLKNVNEGTNFCVESDNALYQKYIKEYGEYKENQAAKRGKKTNKCVYSVRIMQQIGIYTVLILPILLSIAVVILIFCLPVKSFSDYTGWLFTIIYALNCLSVLTLLILWIVLAIADRNPNFEGFGVGVAGGVTCVTGICLGIPICIILWGSPPWWYYLIISYTGGVYLGCFIWGLVKHKNKSIARFLLVSLLSVLWGSATCSGGFAFSSFTSLTDYYEKNPDGTYTYVINNDKTVDLEIPSEYCGKPVTAVGRNENIELTNLKTVSLPVSVTSIEEGVFLGCSGLESLTVPYVGYYYTSGVKDYDGEAEILDSIGYLFGTVSYDGGVATEQYHRGKYISGDKAGKEGYGFSRIYYIPASLKNVTVLGGDICCGAFYGCTNLESVTIGDGVTSIGKDAFFNCGAVQKTKGISYIDNKWIVGCDRTVKETKLSSDMVGIADFAFADCTSFASVTLNEGLKVIGESAFQGTKISTLGIPQSVTFIGANAFKGCTLSDVVFDNVEEWYAEGTYISSSDLIDSQNASTYLTSTYVNCIWKQG